MLLQRVITAILLLLIFTVCISAPSPWPFVILFSLALALANWEWARLNGMTEKKSCVVGILFFISSLFFALFFQMNVILPALVWFLAICGWLAGVIFILWRGQAAWSRVPRWIRLFVGIVTFSLVWLAVLTAYARGVYFMLSLLSLVWVADVGAYFFGRGFGQKIIRKKLAPRVSPGKSWEGVLGGAASVILLAILFLWFEKSGAQNWSESFYSIIQRQGLPIFILICLGMTALSVIGDLFESLVKRSAGYKDSSHILPGHGGVLDRIDAIIPVLLAGIFIVACV